MRVELVVAVAVGVVYHLDSEVEEEWRSDSVKNAGKLKMKTRCNGKGKHLSLLIHPTQTGLHRVSHMDSIPQISCRAHSLPVAPESPPSMRTSTPTPPSLLVPIPFLVSNPSHPHRL